MITVSNVQFGYRHQTVFNGLNFQVQRGGIYGLLGRNGSGKSTLMKLLSGLLFPRQGKIQVLGYNPEQRHPGMLSQVYMLPEEFDLPNFSMQRYAEVYGVFYPKFSQERLRELMQAFGVSETQNLHQMSFGQKKKACIAFAIACNTPLLLMDEPTNGLDIPSKSLFRQVMAAEADSGRVVIISTHQVRDLDHLIDSVLVLDGSEMLLNASVGEITRRLRFTHLRPDEPMLYAEPTIHGLWGVQVNQTGEDSPLDMELLFNAVIAQREVIKQLFNSVK